jgi:membrane protein
MRRWLHILRNTLSGWSSDNAFQHSAAVSFYTLFSMAPVTIIAVGIAGFFLGRERAVHEFTQEMNAIVGKDSSKVIETTMAATRSHEGNLISTIVGAAILVVGATSVFSQLQDSLNEIWGVRAEPKRSGVAVIVAQRLISFGMVLTLCFILLVSLILTTVLTALIHNANGRLSVPAAIAEGVNTVVTLLVITLLFGSVFRILPDVQLRWRDVLGSAFFSAVLFTGGRYLIAVYLSHSTVASIYGAAGSLVALLVWIYYSCAIMFFGVEYAKARKLESGTPIRPKKHAVLIRTEYLSGGP